jgi:hypothetical protein
MTPTLYSTVADLIGLQSQDNQFLFAGISTGSLLSVDLSIDDIVSLMGTGSQDIIATGSLSSIEPDIRSTMMSMTQRDRVWMSWV